MSSDFYKYFQLFTNLIFLNIYLFGDCKNETCSNTISSLKYSTCTIIIIFICYPTPNSTIDTRSFTIYLVFHLTEESKESWTVLLRQFCLQRAIGNTDVSSEESCSRLFPPSLYLPRYSHAIDFSDSSLYGFLFLLAKRLLNELRSFQ